MDSFSLWCVSKLQKFARLTEWYVGIHCYHYYSVVRVVSVYLLGRITIQLVRDALLVQSLTPFSLIAYLFAMIIGALLVFFSAFDLAAAFLRILIDWFHVRRTPESMRLEGVRRMVRGERNPHLQHPVLKAVLFEICFVLALLGSQKLTLMHWTEKLVESSKSIVVSLMLVSAAAHIQECFLACDPLPMGGAKSRLRLWLRQVLAKTKSGVVPQ